MSSRGIWINDTTFHAFAEPAQPGLAEHIATRAKVGDFSAFMGLLPNPDPVLKKMGRDIAVYEELASDAHVKGCLRRRRGAVKAMERGFMRGDVKGRVAKNLQAIFDDLPIARLVGDMVNGAFYGCQPFEVLWARVGTLQVPVDVVRKPTQWFGYTDDGELRLRSTGHQLKGEPLPPRRFVVARNNASYANPYGEPDLASVFWPTTFKRGGLKFWVTFTEKYGMPWAVGKLPRQGVGPKDYEDLRDKLEAMVRDAVAVVPDDSSVELLTTGNAANADMFERLLTFCRSETSIALLGNNQSVEASANLASAKAAQEVEADLREDDAQMVSEALTCLARWIVQVNWGDGTDTPAYELWEQEEVDDKLASRDAKLTQAGAKFTKAYFTRAYGLGEDEVEVAEEPDPADPAAGAAQAGQAGGQTARASAKAQSAADDDGAATFAEGEPTADQAGLDAAIAALPVQQVDAAMRTLLQPALDAINAAQDYTEALRALQGAYPRMQADELQQLLTTAFAVADAWGAHHAARAGQE